VSVAQQQRGGGYLGRPAPSGLADVVEIILDKGLVIDAYVRVSLVGIELLTIDARIVIASVDTYLRFAEAVGRLDLNESDPTGLPELVDGITSGAAKSKTSGAIEGAKEKLEGILSGGDDEEEEEEEEKPRKRTSSSRSRSSSSGSRSRSKS
jgi:hypothetical protein